MIDDLNIHSEINNLAISNFSQDAHREISIFGEIFLRNLSFKLDQ